MESPQACSSDEPRRACPGRAAPLLRAWWTNSTAVSKLALDVAQEAEDGGDLGDGVLVDGVQADQGVEDHEAGPDALHGVQ